MSVCPAKYPKLPPPAVQTASKAEFKQRLNNGFIPKQHDAKNFIIEKMKVTRPAIKSYDMYQLICPRRIVDVHSKRAYHDEGERNLVVVCILVKVIDEVAHHRRDRRRGERAKEADDTARYEWVIGFRLLHAPITGLEECHGVLSYVRTDGRWRAVREEREDTTSTLRPQMADMARLSSRRVVGPVAEAEEDKCAIRLPKRLERRLSN